MINVRSTRLGALAALLPAAFLLVQCNDAPEQSETLVTSESEAPVDHAWTTWGGDLHNSRYAPFDQINGDNFEELGIAWRWKARQILGKRDDWNWKATPLYVDGVLYLPTGGTTVVALDAGTGDEIWSYTPEPEQAGSRRVTGSSRAVSYWTDGTSPRIIHNTMDGRILSIDAATGLADPDFGQGGFVDMNENLLAEGDDREAYPVGSTTPAIVVGDVIVAQCISNDSTPRNNGTPCYVRGYDVRTGAHLWTFHTIPREGEFGVETWENKSWKEAGSTGVWSMMSADPELGLVYLPVESPTNNFWAGWRPGDNLFGESIVALDAKTGERAWHFQILHHGVWDYDLPAAPILHDVEKDGTTIKALTVLTKQGMAFVFNRETGEPIWPIEERPVPTEMGVPGEALSPTQPFPTKPAPYSNLGYHEEDVIDFTPELKAEALKVLERYTKGPMYTPPTLVSDTNDGTLIYPNFGGGSNWNGGALDPETNTIFVPTREMFMGLGLEPGNPERTDWAYVPARRRSTLLNLENGLPVKGPPWALVTATDMDEGEHIWSRSIGGAPDWVREHPALEGLDLDFDNMGQISVRPSPLVTKAAMFLAESSNIGGDPGDRAFRAYDKISGEVVGEIMLPALTSGAPMSYMHEGRQYIAIALSSRDYPAELVVLGLPGEGGEVTALDGEARQTRSDSFAQASSAVSVVATEEELSRGAKLFATNCAVCHGADGAGIAGGNAPSIRGIIEYDRVRQIIENGSAEMPAMGAVMSEPDRDAVTKFVLLRLVDEPAE